MLGLGRWKANNLDTGLQVNKSGGRGLKTTGMNDSARAGGDQANFLIMWSITREREFREHAHAGVRGENTCKCGCAISGFLLGQGPLHVMITLIIGWFG